MRLRFDRAETGFLRKYTGCDEQMLPKTRFLWFDDRAEILRLKFSAVIFPILESANKLLLLLRSAPIENRYFLM